MAFRGVIDGRGKQVYGYLPMAALEEFDRHAHAERMSRSQMLTKIILDYLKRNRVALPQKEAEAQAWEGGA